jgi:D-alanyl-D-alanine carboxypeptidase (penicillin-binding protein 5/6)
MAMALAAGLLVGGSFVGNANASTVIGGPLLSGTGVIVRALPTATPLPKIDADTWLLADLTTGEVLAAKNPHAPVRPASTLKTLTSVTLMPALNRNAVHTATDRDVRVDGSHVGIVSGATYTVWDLWHGLLLPSGNDAATALANQYGGVSKTVGAMQLMAQQLQAYDTHVVNPSGLDADGQVSSAYDMALIAAAALQIPDFRTVTTTKSYDFPGFMPKAGQARKTFKTFTENRLLRHNYQGIAGGKTGFTSLAHRTFWGAAQRNGHLLIVTLFQIHEPTEKAATSLLNWGFANRAKVQPVGALVSPKAEGSSPESTTSKGSSPMLAESGTQPASADTAKPASAAAASPLPWLIAIGAIAASLGAIILRRRTVGNRSAARAPGRHVSNHDALQDAPTDSVR